MSTITMTLDLPDNITLNIEELKKQFQGIINLFATPKNVVAEPMTPFEVSRKQVENGELYEAKDLDDLFKQLND